MVPQNIENIRTPIITKSVVFMSIVSCFYSYIIDYSHIIDYSSVTDQDIQSLYLDVVYKSNMIYCDVVYFLVHFNTRMQFFFSITFPGDVSN